MSSSKYLYNSLVKFSIFYILLHKCILFSGADNTNTNTSNCLNPSFAKNQKIVVHDYYTADTMGLARYLCQIIAESNGLIKIDFHICNAMSNKANCWSDDKCTEDRARACFYKYYSDQSNKCYADIPVLEPPLMDCICTGSADDYLTSSEAARIKYGITKFPGMVINDKFDPCFNDLSYEFLKKYFCKAYNNEFPGCKS